MVFDVKICEKCLEKPCKLVCNSGAISVFSRDYLVKELMDEVKKDEQFYINSGGGVTVSGGEPLLQAEFLKEFLKACKVKGYHTAIETCSYAEWQNFNKVIPYTDLFLCDIKHMDNDKHLQFTGVKNELILENLQRLRMVTEKIIIRVPVIPGFNDDEGNIRQICEFAMQLQVEEMHLLPFHRLGQTKYEQLFLEYLFKEGNSPAKEDMLKLKQLVEGYGIQAQIGG